MARSRRSSEVGFFSFSFLDILACTVGVLVFMIAIIVLHTLGMSAPVPLRTELSNVNLDISKLNHEIEKLKKETDEKRRIREAIEQLDEIQAKLKLSKELEEYVAEYAARLNKLKEKEDLELDELKRLRALVPDDFTIKKQNVELHNPVQQESTKRALYFECDDDKVNPFFGRYIRKYYSTKGLGGSSVVIRRRPGESLEQIVEESSDWRSEISRIDPEKEYVAFVVRPSGFNIFMQLRKALSRKNIDVAWEPLETGAINMVIENREGGKRFLLQ
ncbi:MAG: hypothetical protein JW941_13040 [Candidatus Coatesbacteria bacterium]|nr:hypothetical protein [Candidatus Coatesbacteria bacterium]